MKFKNVLLYLLYLLPWFLSGIFINSNSNYYYSLNLPFFAPNPILFAIIWPILYILIAYSIFKTFNDSTTNYKIYLFINYLANQLFTFCFFYLRDNFLALVDVIIIFISSLYLYVETKLINKKYSWYLIPYIIWNLFALILIFTIFYLN